MQNSTNTTVTPMPAPSAKLVRVGDGGFITAIWDTKSHTIRESESPDAFKKALKAIDNEDWDALYSAMRPVKAYAEKIDNVEVQSDGVYFDGKLIHNAVAKRILDFVGLGLSHVSLSAFLSKLMKNPSKRAVSELYNFLEHQNLPITDNGNFWAYKAVKNDWYSVHSGESNLIQGTVDSRGHVFNGIGEVIEMPRNEVDDNKDVACSEGLHAGTLEYAKGFYSSGRLLIVEVDPADVVSIPSDSNCQKLRTCRYKVISECEAPLTEPLYESKWKNDSDYSSDEENFEDSNESDEPCVPAREPIPESGSDSFHVANSSWINGVYWDNTIDKPLTINTVGGDIVHYDVPEWRYRDFQNAIQRGESAGQFYNRMIKNQYPTE